jgi:hypothetical protein
LGANYGIGGGQNGSDRSGTSNMPRRVLGQALEEPMWKPMLGSEPRHEMMGFQDGDPSQKPAG